MAALLVGLRLDLLVGAVRQPLARTIAVVLATIAAVVSTALVAARFGGLHGVQAGTSATIVVPVGALVTLAFALVPLARGSSDQLDPRRFATFGVARRPLAVGLAAVGLIGVPSLCVAVLAVAQVVTWARTPGTAVLAILGAVLVVATCAMTGRVAASTGAWLTDGRPGRWAPWAVAVLVVVIAAAVAVVLHHATTGAGAASSAVVGSGAGTGAIAPRSAAAVGTGESHALTQLAGWTPFGAAWAVPADAATGHGGRAVLRLLIALATLAALGAAWWALVGRMLVTVGRPEPVAGRPRLGWFALLGHSAVGAVAARSLVYWVRDVRYRTSYVVIAVIPAVVLPLGVAGVPWHLTALVPLPLMALVAGFLPHNDVAHDNTAVWLHIVSGAPGWTDRLGRVVPVLVVGVPLLVVGAVVSAVAYGDLAETPVLIGVAGAALLAGLGLSSVASALLPYPTVRPGDRPFQQPQASGVLATVSQSAMILGTAVLSAPAGWLAVRFVLGDGAVRAWQPTVVGIGTGVVVLALGVLVGGRVFDRVGPDILAAAQRN